VSFMRSITRFFAYTLVNNCNIRRPRCTLIPVIHSLELSFREQLPGFWSPAYLLPYSIAYRIWHQQHTIPPWASGPSNLLSTWGCASCTVSLRMSLPQSAQKCPQPVCRGMERRYSSAQPRDSAGLCSGYTPDHYQRRMQENTSANAVLRHCARNEGRRGRSSLLFYLLLPGLAGLCSQGGSGTRSPRR